MKRLIQVHTPIKMASAEKEYSLVAGDCDFEGCGLVFPTAFGDLAIPEIELGPFLNLADEIDLAQFAIDRPDVIVVNYG